MARRIADDATGTWRRLITDDCRKLLDYEAKTYQPPAKMARHVRARDQVCAHPGCNRKAIHCELDHREPWPGGPTSVRNLRPLCKRHHDLKHHSQWKLTKDDDGTHQWTAPTGHHYNYRPPPLPPAITEPVTPPEPDHVADDEPPPF